MNVFPQHGDAWLPMRIWSETAISFTWVMTWHDWIRLSIDVVLYQLKWFHFETFTRTQPTNTPFTLKTYFDNFIMDAIKSTDDGVSSNAWAFNVQVNFWIAICFARLQIGNSEMYTIVISILNIADPSHTLSYYFSITTHSRCLCFVLVHVPTQRFNSSLNLCCTKIQNDIVPRGPSLMPPWEKLSNERWQVNCLEIEMPYDVRACVPFKIHAKKLGHINKKKWNAACVCGRVLERRRVPTAVGKWNPT